MFPHSRLFVKIFANIFNFAMITRSNSVANALDNILNISKVETEFDEASSYANQSEFEDDVTSSVRNKLSCDSVEDINCRICYDPNQELPIIYPCKCKV